MIPDSSHSTLHCLKLSFIIKMLVWAWWKKCGCTLHHCTEVSGHKSPFQNWKSLGPGEGWGGRFVRSPLGRSTSTSRKPVYCRPGGPAFSLFRENKVSAAFYHWCQCWKSRNNGFALSPPKIAVWLTSDTVANLWWPSAEKSCVAEQRNCKLCIGETR